jgi:hypothetical protein
VLILYDADVACAVIVLLQLAACVPTYPAAEAQLLAAVCSSSSSNSTGSVQQQTAEAFTATQQLQQQRQPGLLQRLLFCGSRRPSSRSRLNLPQQPESQQQQQHVLQLAKTPFSNDSSMHLVLLQAVYCAYTGACAEPGRHASDSSLLAQLTLCAEG